MCEILNKSEMSWLIRHLMGKYPPVIITSMLLLILIPVSAFSNNEIINSNDVFYGSELEIEFGHDITYADWIALEKEGFTPLRQISKNKMLVWSESLNSKLYNNINYKILEVKDKNNVNQFDSLYFSKFRVLLEPHLPTSGVIQVLEVLKQYPIQIQNYPSLKTVGSMPESFEIKGLMPNDLEIDGVWKIEEVKVTHARNDVAASIIESGSLTNHELWERGLNGEGVLIAVADTGIDLDHACFRDSVDTTGTPGDSHRKVQLLNTTIDSWDSSNNSDFGHGTHIAGSLSCNWINGELGEGSSLSYNSRLLVQDVVSENGWEVPENVDVLFLEAAQNGAVIHSDSWGDNEVNYTKRSGDFDGWGREVPWSLIFVAPGNSGGQLMEPANARNVIAVGSTTKNENLEMLSFSSIGPTNLGTRGIFLVAPGKNIVSAKSDGVANSLNNDTYSLTGTSMSTPIAASGAAIIQQMVEQGLFNTNDNSNGSGGFTPSGPLMKALLSLATTSLSNSNIPDSEQGWGVLNISEILPNDFFENNKSTIDNVWIWDSYQYDGDWSAFTDSRIENNITPLNSLTQNSWDGSGARGPFLSTGEEIRWNFTINREEDIEARLSWLAKPEPYLVDELEISIITSDGRIAYGNDLGEDGFSRLYSIDPGGPSAENETTIGINLNLEDLAGVDWIHVIVKGSYIGIGNNPGSIGIEGDRLGFGLSIKGIGEEQPVKLSGGGFENIVVEHVLGYTYVGAGGIFEQINFEFAKSLNWNFTNNPGNLAVELDINAPRNISANLSNSPFGFETLSEGIDIPLCSTENETLTGVNSSRREWSLQGIWWPPALTDCKGNHMTFNLDSKRLEAPEALKDWRAWVAENSNSDFVAVEMYWDLSDWEIPWVEGGVIPERLSCEFQFESYAWQSCDLFMSEIIHVPKDVEFMELKWSWKENTGSNRILAVKHLIPQFQIKDLPSLSFDYSDNDENLLTIRGDVSDDSLLILLSESKEHAFVNIVNSSWNLDNTTMSCSSENYWVMGVDTTGSIDFDIGNNAMIYDDGNLTISALELNQSWEQKIEIGQIIYLTLENKDEGHTLSLPLKNFDLLKLHGYCDEVEAKSTNLLLNGLFSMWILLSLIMLISAIVMWKKQKDLAASAKDEES